jgi:hypothetical protein
MITIDNTVESGKMEYVYTWEMYQEYYTIVENEVKEIQLGPELYLPNIYIATRINYDSNSGYFDLYNKNLFTGNMQSDDFINSIRGRYISINNLLSKTYKIPDSPYIRIVKDKDGVLSIYNTNQSESDAILQITMEKVKSFIGLITSNDLSDYPLDGKAYDEYRGIYCYYKYCNFNIEPKEKCIVNDTSYEEGHVYPYTEITILGDGDLNIHNDIEDRNTYIANCVAGEVITMDYPIIKSSVSSHNIQNDFNWNFLRIANTFNNVKNGLTISIPCKIKLKYSPIVKVGL